MSDLHVHEKTDLLKLQPKQHPWKEVNFNITGRILIVDKKKKEKRNII